MPAAFAVGGPVDHVSAGLGFPSLFVVGAFPRLSLEEWYLRHHEQTTTRAAAAAAPSLMDSSTSSTRRWAKRIASRAKSVIAATSARRRATAVEVSPGFLYRAPYVLIVQSDTAQPMAAPQVLNAQVMEDAHQRTTAYFADWVQPRRSGSRLQSHFAAVQGNDAAARVAFAELAEWPSSPPDPSHLVEVDANAVEDFWAIAQLLHEGQRLVGSSSLPLRQVPSSLRCRNATRAGAACCRLLSVTIAVIAVVLLCLLCGLAMMTSSEWPLVVQEGPISPYAYFPRSLSGDEPIKNCLIHDVTKTFCLRRPTLAFQTSSSSWWRPPAATRTETPSTTPPSGVWIAWYLVERLSLTSSSSSLEPTIMWSSEVRQGLARMALVNGVLLSLPLMMVVVPVLVVGLWKFGQRRMETLTWSARNGL